MKRTTKIFTLFSLVMLFTLVFVPAAYAFDGRGGDRIIIGKDEIIDEDLYLGASEIIIEGTINGDLMAAGDNVIINGTVSGDVFAGGSTVTLNGSVGDDLFAAAAAVTLGPDAVVGDDVFSAAAGVEAQAGSQVGGTFLLGASQGLLAGSIAEDLKAGTNSLRLEGSIGGSAQVAVDNNETNIAPQLMVGDSDIRLPQIPGGLSFGEGAVIEGSLAVISPESVSVPASVTEDVTHSLPPYDAELVNEFQREATVSSPVIDAIRRLVALLLVGALIGWLMPGWIRRLSDTIQGRPLPSLGLGALNLVAAPLILLTLIGVVIMTGIVFAALSLGNLAAPIIITGLLLIGIAVMAFILSAAYLCQAAIAYIGGRWILSKFHLASEPHLMWSLLLGLLISGLVFAIPVAGWVIQLFVIFIGLGAILISVWESRKATPAASVVPVTEG
jgi:hypothetical protein